MVAGSRPSGMTQSTASAPVNSTLARVVSKCVFDGITLPGPADDAEQDLLGGPTLVRRDHVAERPQLGDGVEEAEPGRRPGVRLVAALDAGPLLGAHGAGARVGQQVDEDVVGVEVEQVVAGVAQPRRTFLDGGQPDRLDALDPEGLDDRSKAVHDADSNCD